MTTPPAGPPAKDLGTQGITEHDIAEFLVNTPGFFERHAELLASVQLTSPHGQRAVSLQERQMEMLRGKIKGLEQRIVDMVRHGQENLAIADRLHRWTRALMLVPRPADVPRVLLDGLRREFLVPQAALRVWGADAAHAGEAYAQPVGDDAQRFAAGLRLPYCGPAPGFEAARWLDGATAATSLALIPLRLSASTAFGLLVLGSPDPARYANDMGTEFLIRIGETASAALARLLRPE